MTKAGDHLVHLARYMVLGIQPDRERLVNAIDQFNAASTKLTLSVEIHQAAQRLKQITPKP